MNGYEAFGLAAQRLTAPIVLGGRNEFSGEDMVAIRQQNVVDVLSKLQPRSTDRLLDIGCGVGFILTPLASHVAEVVGLDHPALLARYQTLGVPANVQLVGGSWPQSRIDGTFDRILAYSVMHYLSGEEEARVFIQRCIDTLRPGGRILLGEIPNQDMQRRFKDSRFGRQFDAQWRQRQASLSEEHRLRGEIFSRAENHTAYLTDNFLWRVLADARRQGLEAYLLPEPEGLPFCYSREDIVLWRRD